MKQTATRWSVHLLALVALGPLAGLLVASLRAADGGPDATLLVCTTPAAGLLAGIGALAIAGLIAIVGARLVDARAGLFAAGIVLAWAAARSGRVDIILMHTQSSAPLVRLALEGVLVGAGSVLIAIVAYAVGKPSAQTGDAPDARPPLGAALAGSFRRAVAGPGLLVALPVAIVAGGAGAWLIAATPMKGQTIGAAVAAGVLAGAAGRVADQRSPAQMLCLAIAILAALGPLSAFVFQRGANPVDAAYAGSLFALARIAPLDWVAGGLIGVPIGVSWAGSMIDKRLS